MVKPSEQLLPKRWPLSNPNVTKIILTNISRNRHRHGHRNPETKNRQQGTTTELPSWAGDWIWGCL